MTSVTKPRGLRLERDNLGPRGGDGSIVFRPNDRASGLE
jgi:hypothetical protein